MSFLLSIIIPTYNRAHLIEKTIRSVLDQTAQNYEVLVIDDGSTDNTEEVVAKYISDNFRYFKIPNSERGAARNTGTKYSRGKYVNWFDSDDEMLPNHVAAFQEMVEKHNSPEVITLTYSFKDAKTEEIIPKIFQGRDSKRNFLITGNYLACNPVIVRKDIADLNPFIEDRDLSASEDYELWLRLYAQFPFCHSSEITSYLILHDERSVVTMTHSEKLEKRFLSFLKYTCENELLRQKLGKDFYYFKMRNYLILAVDLAYNGFKMKALHYLRVAVKTSTRALTQKVFWATLKHICLK
jgi:glycosyltransferase involved in cell wall biosynthesis